MYGQLDIAEAKLTSTDCLVERNNHSSAMVTHLINAAATFYNHETKMSSDN